MDVKKRIREIHDKNGDADIDMGDSFLGKVVGGVSNMFNPNKEEIDDRFIIPKADITPRLRPDNLVSKPKAKDKEPVYARDIIEGKSKPVQKESTSDRKGRTATLSAPKRPASTVRDSKGNPIKDGRGGIVKGGSNPHTR